MSAEKWMKHLEMFEKVRRQVRAKERAEVAEQERIRQEAEKRALLRELRLADDASQALESCSKHCKEVNEEMDETMQEKLANYLELLDVIKERTEDERTAVALLQEISKDRRMEQIRQERSSNGEAPATENQIRFLRNLGAVIPEGGLLSRRQASKLIEDTKAAIRQMDKAGKVPIRVP